MRPSRRVGLVALVLAAACAKPAPRPPADMPRTIAVLQPHNATGGPLTVAGSSLLERYAFGTEVVTVSDVLGAEARFQLEQRGFTVVPADTVAAATEGRAPTSVATAAEIAVRGRLPGLALFVDVLRWDPDAPTEPRFVIVNATATLLDAATGRVVWTNRWPTRPVPTLGFPTLGGAYIAATRKVAEALLAPLGSAR